MLVEKYGWAIPKSLFAEINPESAFSHGITGKLQKQSIIVYLPVSQNLKTWCMRIAFHVWLEETNKQANLQNWKACELDYLGKQMENRKKSSK